MIVSIEAGWGECFSAETLSAWGITVPDPTWHYMLIPARRYDLAEEHSPGITSKQPMSCRSIPEPFWLIPTHRVQENVPHRTVH